MARLSRRLSYSFRWPISTSSTLILLSKIQIKDTTSCFALHSLLMSLYYDAATVLTSDALQGSLKSRVYNGNAGIKAKPAHVYALISECAKYDTFLKEVIDNAAILAHEPKVCASLSRSTKSPLTDPALAVCLALPSTVPSPGP